MSWYNTLLFRMIMILVSVAVGTCAFWINWKAATVMFLSWWICNLADVLKPKKPLDSYIDKYFVGVD